MQRSGSPPDQGQGCFRRTTSPAWKPYPQATLCPSGEIEIDQGRDRRAYTKGLFVIKPSEDTVSRSDKVMGALNRLKALFCRH